MSLSRDLTTEIASVLTALSPRASYSGAIFSNKNCAKRSILYERVEIPLLSSIGDTMTLFILWFAAATFYASIASYIFGHTIVLFRDIYYMFAGYNVDFYLLGYPLTSVHVETETSYHLLYWSNVGVNATAIVIVIVLGFKCSKFISSKLA